MKRPNRKEYINKHTKVKLIADLELYINHLEAQLAEAKAKINQERVRSIEKVASCETLLKIKEQETTKLKEEIERWRNYEKLTDSKINEQAEENTKLKELLSDASCYLVFPRVSEELEERVNQALTQEKGED